MSRPSAPLPPRNPPIPESESGIPGHLEFERAWRERWSKAIDDITAKHRVKKKAIKDAKREADQLLIKLMARSRLPNSKPE